MRSDCSRWVVAVVAAAVLAAAALAAGRSAGLPAALGALQPRLSPDGRRIAVSFHGAIGVVPVGGGKLTILTRGEGNDVEPAWTPDGRVILYVNSAAFGDGTLERVEAASGRALPFPRPVRAGGPLFVHPDGTRVLGRFAEDAGPLQLSWCGVADGRVSPLAGVAPGARYRYALSNDGQTIAFAEHQDRPGEQGGNDGPQADVWTAPADGGSPRRAFRFPARVYNLCWESRDQSLLLVSDLGVSHYDLWRVQLSDPERSAEKLTRGQADEDWPSTTADGRLLLYTDNRAGATTLMLLRGIGDDLEAAPVRIERLEPAEPAARLTVEIVDRTSGAPLTARLSVQRKGGKFTFPPGALHRHTTGLGHFYCKGAATWDVPAGTYLITAFRGLETREWRREVRIAGRKETVIRIELERWIDLAGKGYYSGENHVHANYGYGAWYNTPATVLDQCEGEDLNVCNVMVANSDGDGVYDREFFRGGADPNSTSHSILYWNQEFRSTIWGHMTLFNLRSLVEPIFTGFKDTTNPWDIPTNAEIADRTHLQRAGISYTHPAGNRESPYDGAYSAKGMPVDVALGKIDTIDVMGFGYDATLDVWYRLLNCGFRLPAAAGTDCFLNRVPSYPPGWGRCYVKLPQRLTYVDWVLGQQAGRSFISKGAALFFTAAEREPGDRLVLSGPGPVAVSAEAVAQYPLDRLEIIRNGAVAAVARPSTAPRRITCQQTVQMETGGWLAARVYGASPPYYPGNGVSAHSNPVWVTAPGRPQVAREEARYFLAWIDRLEGDLRRRGRVPPGTDVVSRQIEGARAVYRRIGDRGRPSGPGGE